MADLPPIPDEALHLMNPTVQPDARRALHAAWPHLYAAALRHAADLIHDGYGTSGLRRLADEATP